MSADLTTDVPAAVTLPRRRDASPAPVDRTLVRRLHEASSTALAEDLERRPTLSTVAQQELARTLVQDGVDELVRQRMRAGQAVTSPDEEQVVSEAVSRGSRPAPVTCLIPQVLGAAVGVGRGPALPKSGT